MNRLIFLILVFSTQLWASTFVGNGGSILDTELRSTLKRLEAAVKASAADEQLCTCEGDSDQCGVLRDLDDEQVAFCQDLIHELRPEFLKILSDESAVDFQWSAAPLHVEGEDPAYDAIAQRKERRILLNEKRFASLTTAGRVQLLAHEYLHLLPYKGQALEDTQDVGPFRGKNGGRQLLDAVGAALAITGMRIKRVPIVESIQSRPFYNVAIHLTSGLRQVQKDERESSLLGRTVDQNSFGFTYYPRVTDNWGWSIRSYTEDDTDSGLIEARIQKSLTMLGTSYRLVPFQSGNRFLDSIHFSGFLGVGYGHVEHSLRDPWNQLKAKRSLWAVQGDLGIHIPLIWNFWLSGGTGAIYAPYSIDSLHIETKSLDPLNHTGVTYAFQF